MHSHEGRRGPIAKVWAHQTRAAGARDLPLDATLYLPEGWHLNLWWQFADGRGLVCLRQRAEAVAVAWTYARRMFIKVVLLDLTIGTIGTIDTIDTIGTGYSEACVHSHGTTKMLACGV